MQLELKCMNVHVQNINAWIINYLVASQPASYKVDFCIIVCS